MRRSTVCTRKFQPPRLSVNSTHLSLLRNNNIVDNNSNKVSNDRINEPVKLSTSSLSSTQTAIKRDRQSFSSTHVMQDDNKENVINNNNTNSAKKSKRTRKESSASNKNKETTIRDKNRENEQHEERKEKQEENINDTKTTQESDKSARKSIINDERDNNLAESASKRLLFEEESIINEEELEKESNSSNDKSEEKEEGEGEEEHIDYASLHHIQHAWQANTIRPNQSREAVHRVVYYPPLKPPSTLSTPTGANNFIISHAAANNVNGLGMKHDSNYYNSDLIQNNNQINNNDGHNMYITPTSNEHIMQMEAQHHNNATAQVNIVQENKYDSNSNNKKNNININTETINTETLTNTKSFQNTNISNNSNTVIIKQNSVNSPEHSSTSPTSEMYIKSNNLAQASLSPFVEMEGISQHTEFLRALEFQQQREFEREQQQQYGTVLLTDQYIKENDNNTKWSSNGNIDQSVLTNMEETYKNNDDVEPLKQTNITTSIFEENYKPENNCEAVINEQEEEHHNYNNNDDGGVSGAIRQLFCDNIVNTVMNDNTVNKINSTCADEVANMQKVEEEQSFLEDEEYKEFNEEQELIEDEEMLERELEEDIRLSTDIAFTPTTTTNTSNTVNMLAEINASTNFAFHSNNTCSLTEEPMFEENTEATIHFTEGINHDTNHCIDSVRNENNDNDNKEESINTMEFVHGLCEEQENATAMVDPNVQVKHMTEDNTLLTEDEKSISLCQEADSVQKATTNNDTYNEFQSNNGCSDSLSCNQVYPMFLPPSQQPPIPGQNMRTRTVFRFKSNSMSTGEEEQVNNNYKNNNTDADHVEEAAMTNTNTAISTLPLSTDGRPKRTLFVFKTKNDKEVDAEINVSNSITTNNNFENEDPNNLVTSKEKADNTINVGKDSINIHIPSRTESNNTKKERKHFDNEENNEKEENIRVDTNVVTTRATAKISTKEDEFKEEQHHEEVEQNKLEVEQKEEENEERIKINHEEHNYVKNTECNPVDATHSVEENNHHHLAQNDENINNNINSNINDDDNDGEEENTFYDLPSNVGVLFATHRGVYKLYPWQHNVLTREDVRSGFNFVYSMPTSGGKTLVAEIALLRCVLLRHKSCMFVLPYVSLAEEKTVALQPFAEAFDFSVDGHYGMTGHFPLPKSPALFVCTIEKANSVLNYLIEENLSDDLGAVVVDELHMLGESRRGAILELFLSKLLVLHDKRNECSSNVDDDNNIEKYEMNKHDSNKPLLEEKQNEEPLQVKEKDKMIWENTNKQIKPINPLQIIGMSATVPNLNEIAHWLHASFYEGHLRPVPLHQYSVVEGMVLRDGTHNERNLNGSNEVERLFELVTEVEEASVLIFCASRMQCVETAKAIVRYQRQLLTRSASVAIQDHLRHYVNHNNNNNNINKIDKSMGIHYNETNHSDEASLALLAHESPELVEALRSLPPLAAHAIEGLLSELYSFSHTEASQLAEVVPFGVAFHHGGLLAEERELIERAYRQRYIRVLCCTSTLAAGVNLPARRVIFKTPYMGKEFLNKSRYLQMCGRAGRAGWDAFGESFLLLSRRDRQRGHRLMHQELEKCESQMLEDAQSFARALLECVGVKLIHSLHSAQQWITHLFCYYAPGPVDCNLTVTQSEKALAHHEDYQTVLSNCNKSKLSNEVSEETMKLMAHALHYALRLLVKSGLVKQKRVAVAITEEEEKEKSYKKVEMHNQADVESKMAREGGVFNATEKEPQPFVAFALDEDSNSISSAHKMLEAQVIGESADVYTSNTNSLHNNNNNNIISSNNNNNNNMSSKKNSEVLLEVTAFGASSVRSCFSIEEAIAVREELEQLRENGLILADDLHLCYFLTPLREVGNCDWGLYRVLLSRLSDTRQAIANMIGVNEYLIDQRAMGLGGNNNNNNSNSNSNSFTNANSLGNGSELVTDDIKRQLFIARRFFVALMLADVLAEVPMEEIEPKYNVNRGQLQSLMRSASMFSSSITSFCHAMEWYSLEAVLSSFVKRLDFGVKPDLVPLMEIKGVQPARARALWNAGFRDAASIAACEAEEMVQKVRKANAPDSKAAKFFSKRTALMLIREAHVVLERQIKARKGELQALTNRFARS